MRFTRWGEYGILCCVQLARRYPSAAVGAPDIARTQGIPPQYTQQILQRLRKGNVIQSLRGLHGGYTLARPPENITLLEILAATEGETFEVLCDTDPVYENSCESRPCGLRSVWRDVKSAVDSVLSKRSLASLLEETPEATAPLLVQISAQAAQPE